MSDLKLNMLHRSIVLFVGETEAQKANIAELLLPFGWQCRFAGYADAVDEAHEPDTKLIVIDRAADNERILSAIRSIRGLHDFVGGLPILVYGADEHHFAGANGFVSDTLAKDRVLAIIKNWTGPLADHDFRSPDNPRYRLVRMMGLKESDRLFALFVKSLKQGLVDLEKGGDIRHVAHNIAGIAGMMGYADLNLLWSAVSKGEVDRVKDARAETQAFLAELA